MNRREFVALAGLGATGLVLGQGSTPHVETTWVLKHAFYLHSVRWPKEWTRLWNSEWPRFVAAGATDQDRFKVTTIGWKFQWKGKLYGDYTETPGHYGMPGQGSLNNLWREGADEYLDMAVDDLTQDWGAVVSALVDGRPVPEFKQMSCKCGNHRRAYEGALL